MQLARRTTNINRLGVLADDPVVGGNVPIGDIATSEGGGPLDGLARVDVHTVKVTKDDFGVVGAAEGDVLYTVGVSGRSYSKGGVVGFWALWIEHSTYQLRNLGTCHFASVGDGSRYLE